MKYLIIVIVLICSVSVFGQQYVAKVKYFGKGWGYVNNLDTIVIEPTYNKCSNFSKEGLATVTIEEDNYIIYISGNELVVKTDYYIPLAKGGLQAFNNGLLLVRINDKLGYLDCSGKIAIEPKYDRARGFSDGIAIVREKSNLILLDTNGREIVVSKHIKKVFDFTEGLAAFVTVNHKWGYINHLGEVVVEAKYLKARSFHNNLAVVRFDDKKYGYINRKGEMMFNKKFIKAKNFDAESRMAMVKTEEGWIYISDKGVELLVVSSRYYSFFNGLAKGIKDKKVGFFNKVGDWVIAPQFESAKDFKNGYAAVKIDGLWGFIDKKGEIVVNPNFDAIKDMYYVDK